MQTNHLHIANDFAEKLLAEFSYQHQNEILFRISKIIHHTRGKNLEQAEKKLQETREAFHSFPKLFVEEEAKLIKHEYGL